MKILSAKTVSQRRGAVKYSEDLTSVTTFLRHSEDRIEVKNGETVNIDIYDNGKLLFSGDKSELFKKLKGE